MNMANTAKTIATTPPATPMHTPTIRPTDDLRDPGALELVAGSTGGIDVVTLVNGIAEEVLMMR